MHFVVIRPFTYGAISYKIGDGIYDLVFAAIRSDVNFGNYLFFVVPVSDSGANVSAGNGSSGGVSDMPLALGYYSVPAGASTSGVLSNQSTRILSITNTDSTPQGAVINLFDAKFVSDIPTAHKVGSWQLGASQVVDRQFVTSVGLVWEITQGDGTNSGSNNASGTAMNSSGGVDIDYASV
jgi:hypothetical protein